MTATSENVYAAPEVEQQPSGRSDNTVYGCIIVTAIMGLVFFFAVVIGWPIYRDLYPTNPRFKQGDWVRVKGGFYRDLRTHCTQLSKSQIAAALGRSHGSVKRRMHVLNLRKGD